MILRLHYVTVEPAAWYVEPADGQGLPPRRRVVAVMATCTCGWESPTGDQDRVTELALAHEREAA